MSTISVLQSSRTYTSIQEMRDHLTGSGCTRCELGFQPEINGCCVSRGNPSSGRMIIGEAPGKEEDSKRLPFTGPAGRLMDKIFSSVGYSTEQDFYVTNVVKCRPYLPKGSGKENFTPKVEQQKRCRVYLDQETKLIKPKLIVLLGKTAVDNVLPELKGMKMGDLRGRSIKKDGITYFIMIHPAAILHAQMDPALETAYKVQTWEDIQKLRDMIQKENL